MNRRIITGVLLICGLVAIGVARGQTNATAGHDRELRAQELQSTLGTYSQAPRLTNGRVDIPRLIHELEDIHANTYSFAIHGVTTDWDDFQAFLPVAREHGIRVWGSVVPPSESPPHNKSYAEPFKVDYERWAVEFAKLSARETNLIAWSIDDFTYNQKTFNTNELAKMLDAARAINPRLAFVPCCYYRAFTPAFAKTYTPLVDGFLFPYRHESAGANLKDSDTVATEVKRLKELTGGTVPIIVDVYATAHSKLGSSTPEYVEKVMTAAQSSANGVMVYCHQDPNRDPEKYAIEKKLFTQWTAK